MNKRRNLAGVESGFRRNVRSYIIAGGCLTGPYHRRPAVLLFLSGIQALDDERDAHAHQHDDDEQIEFLNADAAHQLSAQPA